MDQHLAVCQLGDDINHHPPDGPAFVIEQESATCPIGPSLASME
jgi:hypothetical protein